MSADTDRADFQAIFKHIPEEFNASLVFGYGSGVFAQAGYSGSMIDFLFVVDDVKAWHEENLLRFPEHYSQNMRFLGAEKCADVQRWGAAVYYNVGVRLSNGFWAKYGVISRDDLMKDLHNWEHLYTAGRLHKPVSVIKSDEQVWGLVETNRLQALRLAMLLLPQRFTRYDLLATIVSLSYKGDIRWKVGEDPRKIDRIVEGQHEELWNIYAPKMEELKRYVSSTGEDWYEQDMDPQAQREIYFPLPDMFRERAHNNTWAKSGGEAWNPHTLTRTLVRINFRSSFTQAAKGFITTGPVKSAQYTFAKMARRFAR